MEKDWDSGLCDCFEDVGTCCYGFWCSLCLAGTVSRRLGENNCLPICDICHCYGHMPIAALSVRVAMRYKYGIKGSICKDIFISFCCPGLSWCQMHRELKYQKKQPNVIYIQTPTVVSMQPGPMMMMPPPVNYMNHQITVQAST